MSSKAKKALKIDHEPYEWEGDTIDGQQLRTLGSVPDNVQIWKKNKGAPDSLVELTTIVDLTGPGIEMFSLQEASTGAGQSWRC